MAQFRVYENKVVLEEKSFEEADKIEGNTLYVLHNVPDEICWHIFATGYDEADPLHDQPQSEMFESD